MDTHFYLPQYQHIVKKIKSTKNFTTIGKIATFSNKTTDFSEYENGKFEYLEISGVSLGTNAYRTTTIEVSQAPSRAKMKTEIGDIVISTTRPHRGAIAEIESKGIVASTGFSIIRSIDNTVRRKWLLYTLLSNCVLKQMLQRSSGGNYPAIIEDEIKNIYIPIVDIGIQEEMIEIIERALISTRQKQKKANELLTQNSKYVLQTLGLSFDIPNKRLAYAIPFSMLEGRIDSDYYSPEFAHFRKQIEESPYKVLSIGEISEKIVSGFAAGKQDQADDLPADQRVPHLRPFSITPEGELSFDTQKFVPKTRLRDEDYCKKNEVVFNNTNSPEWVGKTTVFDSDVLCAASNHMTRITVKDGINPYYVAAFFNVLLSIGYWKLLCTNFNNQAGVNTETLKNVKIPVPPKSVQDEISTELMLRRSKANTLRREAHKEWKEAREQFERKLLGE